MKKIRLTVPAAFFLTLLWLHPAVSGKSPTARVTISGGGLMRALQITDPQVLALSNAWGSDFLDLSRIAADRAPQGLRPYEVTLYTKLAENDVRKACVFYYYPNASNERGFVYLPGHGVLGSLNEGTIVRNGRDGMWNYASLRWEGLIKPAIARAEAERNLVSGSEIAQEPGFPAQPVRTESWTRSQPGWLYVLDPRSESDRPGSRIWLLDPGTSRVMGSVSAGYEADFALSPDGRRLYVASGEREDAELAVIDTNSGNIRHISFPNRILYRPWYDGLPPYSSMAVSSDGRVLGILGQHVVSPGKIENLVWTFDTQGGWLLPATVTLGSCTTARLVSSSTANEFDLLCFGENTLRSIRLDANGQDPSSSSVQLPWPKGCGPVEGFLLPDRNKLAIIRSDGAIYQMDLATQKLSATPVKSDCRDLAVFPFGWPVSPNGAKVYLGYGGLAPNGMSTALELRVFDTSTWQRLGNLQTSVPFWSAVVSRDGKLIYALAPEQRKVLVIDTANLQEKDAISIGKTPALALVAP